MRFVSLAAFVLALAAGHHFAFAQSTQVTISRTNGLARIGIAGQVGPSYTLESASSLSASNWEFQITTPLTASPQTWLDALSIQAPQRFYRAQKLAFPPFEFSHDFRLIDHLGRSRSLYYYLPDTNVNAMVLIFTGNGCTKIREMIPVIKALTNRFAPNGVLFWLVDSNQNDNRSNIVAEAISLGISNGPPILHDAAQLVARAYKATTTPEAIAISRASLQVFYRGAIDDRISSNAVSTTQFYLSNALVRFLAGGVVTPSRTRPSGCAINLSPPFANISYSTEIAPLLQDKCVRCHSPGNIAPFAMTNHDTVVAFATAIKHEVMSGHMPPWKADPHYGQFANDFSLSTTQAMKLVQWIDQGAYKAPGEPDPLAGASVPTNYPFAWPSALGQPDAILRISLQNIPSTGVLNYRYVNVTNTAFSSNVWLRAAVVKPSNTRVVHHCLVLDGSTIGSGLDGFFSGYVPGFDGAAFPPGTGKFLPAGQVLQFQMHYITVGTSQTDQTEIGLYLFPGTPPYPLQTRSAYNITFSIPPHAGDYQAIAKFPPPPFGSPGANPTLTTNIMLYEMSPHMHLRGSHFKYELIYPAGHVPASEVLLSVPNYVFHWQSMFRLAQPKYIPKGSRILCTAGWDNTVRNQHLMDAYDDANQNPEFSPSQTVGFGDQTYDEMFIGYLNYSEVPD